MSLRDAADVHNPDSLSNKMRSRRFEMFAKLIEPLPKPVRVLDVGGTVAFWKQRGWTERQDIHVTLLNLEAEPTGLQNFESVAGDATSIAFNDHAFDVAFSNSVIEHLFTLENQLRMAKEVRRVAAAHWVQTPNFWFPMEPHFHVPGWQWLPKPARVALIRRRQCGWRGPCPDPVEARKLVDEVRLMTRAELERAFPESKIWAEKLYGLSKSYVVYAGFPEANHAKTTQTDANAPS